MAFSKADKSPESVLETPPTSTESECSFSPEDPRPRYYICRDDKTLVPLIAVDELPPFMRIQGVPLSLAAADIEEWDMSRCGDVIDRAKKQYRIEFNTNSSSYQSARDRKPPAAPFKGKQKTPGDVSPNGSSRAAAESLDSDRKSVDYESLDTAGAAGDHEVLSEYSRLIWICD